MILKNFDTRKFPKHRRFPLWNYSALCDKTISKENSGTPLLSIKFSIPDCFWNTKRFLYEKIRPFEAKQFQRKIVIILPPPPLLWSIKTFDTRILLKHRKCTLWNFQFSETKNIRRKVLIGVASVLLLEFFDTGNFLKHWSVPLRNVSVPWDKTKSTEICDNPLLSNKSFHTRMFLKHRGVPQQKVSVHSRKEISTKFRDMSPHPLMHKNLRHEIFP